MDKQLIIEKIKKCLALGKSCEPNEAALAMKRAQELMEKYGVTSDEVALSGISKQTSPMGRTMNPPRYQHLLIVMIKQAFGCEAVLEPVFDGWKWHGHVSFIGFGPSPEIAGYAFEVLFKQITRDRKAYLATLNKRLKRATKIRRGDLFAENWVRAASVKAAALALSPEQKDLLQKWKEQEFLNLKEAAPRAPKFQGRGDYNALAQGAAAGRKATLHHGMDGSGNSQLKIGA